MDAGIAMRPLVCVRPVKNGTQKLSQDKESLNFLKKTHGNYEAIRGAFYFVF
jgi:hypothetical protein